MAPMTRPDDTEPTARAHAACRETIEHFNNLLASRDATIADLERRLAEARQPLFVDGEFTAHSGGKLPFKIECDALTNADIATLAAEIARRFKFSRLIGVPRGGIRLHTALLPYMSLGHGTLIVDDVLTTGHSMEEYRQRVDPKAQGVVIFARGPCPDWIVPLFSVAAPPPPVAEASGEFGHPAPRNFDKERPGPGWKISDDTQRELQEMEQQQRESVARLRSAPQPTADHTEQARELAKRWQPGLYGDPDGLARELLELLTAAERAGAEKAVDYMGSMVAMDYDREACIAGALAARDAALTEGEEEHADRRKP
jgi:hypothetical protein